MPHDISRSSLHRVASRRPGGMSRKSSHARGIGVSNSRRSLLNRSQDEIYPIYDDELINPDEFEEIAEIYDTIRVLHSKQNP